MNVEKKRKFKISKQQKLFLQANIKDSDLKYCLESQKNSKFNNYYIDLKEIQKIKLLDELTFLLTEIGLNSQDEPNDVGLMIEDLIDIFISKEKN